MVEQYRRIPSLDGPEDAPMPENKELAAKIRRGEQAEQIRKLSISEISSQLQALEQGATTALQSDTLSSLDLSQYLSTLETDIDTLRDEHLTTLQSSREERNHFFSRIELIVRKLENKISEVQERERALGMLRDRRDALEQKALRLYASRTATKDDIRNLDYEMASLRRQHQRTQGSSREDQDHFFQKLESTLTLFDKNFNNLPETRAVQSPPLPNPDSQTRSRLVRAKTPPQKILGQPTGSTERYVRESRPILNSTEPVSKDIIETQAKGFFAERLGVSLENYMLALSRASESLTQTEILNNPDILGEPRDSNTSDAIELAQTLIIHLLQSTESPSIAKKIQRTPPTTSRVRGMSFPTTPHRSVERVINPTLPEDPIDIAREVETTQSTTEKLPPELEGHVQAIQTHYGISDIHEFFAIYRLLERNSRDQKELLPPDLQSFIREKSQRDIAHIMRKNSEPQGIFARMRQLADRDERMVLNLAKRFKELLIIDTNSSTSRSKKRT